MFIEKVYNQFDWHEEWKDAELTYPWVTIISTQGYLC